MSNAGTPASAGRSRQIHLAHYVNSLSLEEATEHSEGCEPLVRRCGLSI